MLHSISFKNFFSFKDENTLSFTVNENAPKTDAYFLDKTGTRLTKVMAVFGYNASGKTNALKTISFLQWLIVHAYTEDPNSKIPIIPFQFTNEDEEIELSTKFTVGKNTYVYTIKLTSTKILYEKLQKKELKQVKYSTLFERSWSNSEKNHYTWKDNFNLGSHFKKRLRQNASILATAIRDEHLESIEIANFWKKVSTNLTMMGKDNNEAKNIINAANFFEDNKELQQKANNILKRFDLGLIDIKTKKSETENHDVSFNLSGIHYGGYKLAFVFESSGTRKFYALLKNILFVLENGGVAVLDEFDTDLHPTMSEALVEMFLSPKENPSNAQLIFSAHNPQLLNLLDKYGIVMVEKDKKGMSELWRLDTVTGVRLDDNYYTKYISGAYGARGNIE